METILVLMASASSLFIVIQKRFRWTTLSDFKKLLSGNPEHSRFLLSILH